MNKEDIEALAQEGIINEDALYFTNPDFNGAIVGIDYFGRLIYDYELMVEYMTKQDNICEEDARDFVEYNTLRSLAYQGINAPIVRMIGVNDFEV